MIPRIASRGHSFKGAAQYYLHDKKAQTNDRVGWTHTHNLPTNNAEKAFGWMGYTAMNADSLKHHAGISKTGRKRKAGVVYSFSLSWHPKQEPEKQNMLDAALETLEHLKLKEHEAVIVAHNDEEHSHVHVICNLVHPEHGKVAIPSYDRLTLSTWAENLERNDGEIVCEQRVINNARRRDEAKADRQLALIKHKEEKLELSQKIEDLYNQSDSPKAFKAALGEEGYTLAKGDRRGFVLVDAVGVITSLSRQLKGQRTKDISERLKDVGVLTDAQTLSAQRKEQTFDKEPIGQKQYEANEQNKSLEIAIKTLKPKTEKGKNKAPSFSTKMPAERNTEFLQKLDTLRAWEQKADIQKANLSKQQDSQYSREKIANYIRKLRKEQQNESWISRLNGQSKSTEAELATYEKNLENIDQRIEEQNVAHEINVEKQKPDQLNDQKTQTENYIKHIRQGQNRLNNPDRTRQP